MKMIAKNIEVDKKVKNERDFTHVRFALGRIEIVRCLSPDKGRCSQMY